MKKWPKRIRAVFGTALTWAAAWLGVGTVVGLVLGVVFGSPMAAVAGLAPLFAVAGFLAGATFSAVLALAEGRHTFDEMSLPRFATLGALGGVLLSGFLFLIGMGFSSPVVGWVIAVGALTLLGAGSAAGSLALARRAEDGDLLEAGEKALGQIEGG